MRDCDGRIIAMSFLDYIAYASRYRDNRPDDFVDRIRINVITNFTDDILEHALIGVNLANGVYPIVRKTPYKQYHLELKNPQSELHAQEADITFIFFDINPFKNSEFRSSEDHFESTLRDIEQYAKRAKGTVVIHTFITSYQGAYGNITSENPFVKRVKAYNKKIEDIAAAHPNAVICDTDRLVHVLGESQVFDLRGLFAYDTPFTNDFTAALAEDWFALIRARLGKSKKCIVVDLDNTLWGGVAGELGPLGIALGPDYPGSAFMNFQQALLDFYHRGIILAIVSKNNMGDVKEVFEKNPYMMLKENHFSAIRANWNDKTDNLISIANELNIGLDTMVLIDDDPVNREMVRIRLPEVTVPDFSVPPEEYAKTLFGLKVFHQFSLTDEDKQKGKMYADERQRKKISETSKSIDDYIATLGIVIRTGINELSSVSRLSQLTLKTNQCNLTTKRYAVHDITNFIAHGSLVFGANVADTFGDYGMVLTAILTPHPERKHESVLDTFLMSCRVMGRGVECVVLDFIIRELGVVGIKKIHAAFIPTAKNKPAEHFLEDHGFTQENTDTPGMGYILDIPSYLKNPCPKINKSITITK